jgi:hypothetical protein
MFNEKIYTLEEVSEHLRLTVEAVEKEIAAGRLPAGRIQEFVRVRETDLASYKNEAFTYVNGGHEARRGNILQLNPAPDFTFTWPDGKVEQFTEAREGVISHAGKEYRVKLGFTVRKSSGKRRRRCLILVDRYASVEFVAADEQSNGKMASIIKDRDGKQLPVGATLPPEYNGVPVGPYRDVVLGAGASNGLAVVCKENEFETMVKHAVIRYQFRKDRT